MTDIAKLKPAVRRFIGAAYCGGTGNVGFNQTTIDAALKTGLVAVENKTLGKDAFGAIVVPNYYIPLEHHYEVTLAACDGLLDAAAAQPPEGIK